MKKKVQNNAYTHVHMALWHAGHSVSYSYICDICQEWVNEVGFFLFFLKIPVWLVYYIYMHMFSFYCMEAYIQLCNRVFIFWVSSLFNTLLQIHRNGMWTCSQSICSRMEKTDHVRNAILPMIEISSEHNAY